MISNCVTRTAKLKLSENYNRTLTILEKFINEKACFGFEYSVAGKALKFFSRLS